MKKEKKRKYNENPYVNLIKLEKHMKERDTYSHKIHGLIKSMDSFN